MDHELPQEQVALRVQQLTNEMLAFCGPVFITPGLRTAPEQMVDSGTYSLIDTGERRILVTCHHVWEAYLKERKLNAQAVLCVNVGDGDASIAFASPEKQLIDFDPELDLAVFEFEPAQLYADGVIVRHQKDWFRIRVWPIPAAKDGDEVALMGFSGKRIKKAGNRCTFVAQALPLRVTGVGQTGIWIFNDLENAEVFCEVNGLLGGLSGAPAYSFDSAGATLIGFERGEDSSLRFE